MEWGWEIMSLVSAATNTKFVSIVVCDVSISPDIQMAFLGRILRSQIVGHLKRTTTFVRYLALTNS